MAWRAREGTESWPRGCGRYPLWSSGVISFHGVSSRSFTVEELTIKGLLLFLLIKLQISARPCFYIVKFHFFSLAPYFLIFS